jgi:hypothetical protein
MILQESESVNGIHRIVVILSDLSCFLDYVYIQILGIFLCSRSKRNGVMNKKSTCAVFLGILFVFTFIALFANPNFAQAIEGELTDVIPSEKNSVFLIGDIGGFFTVPIQAWIPFDDDLFLTDTMQATQHELGPVGLALDEANEKLFVSYEIFGSVEVFDASTMTWLATVPLLGADNLAGMVVHQDRGHLYVVDRRELTVWVFDTTTYLLVDSWTVPTIPPAADPGSGPGGTWGIDLLGDWLFITDMTNTVRYFDIDTHFEVDNFTQTYPATAIAVTDYPENLVYTQGHDGVSGMSFFFTKYFLDSGIEENILIGTDPKGVTLNPAGELAYVVADNHIQVVDTANMWILYTKTLNFSWTPTDILASTIAFGSSVTKTCLSHPNGNIHKGDTVIFSISIQNRSPFPIHFMPMKDTYDNTHLSFVSASPATTDTVDDGEVNWTDLIAQAGQDLAVGDFQEVTVTFTATEDCVDELTGTNTAQIYNVEDSDGTALPDASGEFEYQIDCKCRTNFECDDGVYCNGMEICQQDGSCTTPGNPCPVDDGLWCNGDELVTCDEATNACEHTGDPCAPMDCDETDDICVDQGSDDDDDDDNQSDDDDDDNQSDDDDDDNQSDDDDDDNQSDDDDDDNQSDDDDAPGDDDEGDDDEGDNDWDDWDWSPSNSGGSDDDDDQSGGCCG